MSEDKDRTDLGTIGWHMAIALCKADYCDCEEDRMPCRKAQDMMHTALLVAEKMGADSYKIDQIASGEYTLCDGYCHEFCE